MKMFFLNLSLLITMFVFTIVERADNNTKCGDGLDARSFLNKSRLLIVIHIYQSVVETTVLNNNLPLTTLVSTVLQTLPQLEI